MSAGPGQGCVSDAQVPNGSGQASSMERVAELVTTQLTKAKREGAASLLF